jgi:hypothetical protein
MTRPVITALPPAPTRGEDAATFAAKANTFLAALPAYGTESNALGAFIEDEADAAEASRIAAEAAETGAEAAEAGAEAAQGAAEAASNATQWVSGQAYVAGNVVWSPSNYLSYRAVGATSGTTDPSQSASWVLLSANVPRFTNPLAQAVSVQMTASTTVGGVRQLPGVNNNLGAGDFTLVQTDTFKNTGQQILMGKRQTNDDAWYWYINAAGNISFLATVGGVQILSINGGAITAYYNKRTTFSLSVTRETATAAGAWAIYINGVLFASDVIASAATVSLDNTGTLYVNARTTGSSVATTRTDSDFQASRLFNRALTATEVLSLSINGPALADRGASNLVTYSSDFSVGVDGWAGNSGTTITGNQDGIDGEDNWLSVQRTGGTDASRITRTVSGLEIGKRARVSGVKIHNSNIATRYVGVFITKSAGSGSGNAADAFIELASGATGVIPFTEQVKGVSDFTIAQVNSAGVVSSVGTGTTFYVKDIEIESIGLTSELLASNAQSDTGQIFDTSGNKNHALLPASGATVVGRPVSQTREVRWTNTWDGTNELQYIGGVNQAILPANAYIESIVGTVSGATPHDIIVGDGSDTDRYVTITTGLAAGTTSFTLANRTTDGTNLKLTVDPDTDAAMSIAWVISYRILE